MSRSLVSVLAVFAGLLIWFYIVGQTIQDIEVAFALGLVIGTLFGLWIAGGRLLRKMHKDDVQSAHDKYARNKERYL